MAHRRPKKAFGCPPQNQRRARVSFAEMLDQTGQRVHEHSNRRGGRRGQQSVRAAIAAAGPEEDFDAVGWTKRLLRWLWALLVVLPICVVTTWALVRQFSHASVGREFWQSSEFWHFAIGVLLMIGWFCSGLIKSLSLYVYVLGHEFTHGLVVKCFWGDVSGFHASTEGGYITANKTNWVIALSPYFVPIWSIEAAVLYGLLKVFVDFSMEWDKLFYMVIGLTWTFHFVWTLWMIPKDQPDLQENGTLLSLLLIYLGNLLVLVALLCVAGRGSVWDHFVDFGREWLRLGATWGDAGWRWACHGIECLRREMLF